MVPEFVQKLRENPIELDILGDCTQTKLYITVGDCVDALIFAAKKMASSIQVFNVGTADSIDVITIGRLIVEEMGLKEVQ